MKRVVVVISGLGDGPCKQFGGKTPLEYAETPNLNILTKKGRLGVLYSVKEGYIPTSDVALISMFGNGPISSRSQFEALGMGVKLKRGDLSVRTTFATVDDVKNRRIIDRRAGRTISFKEAQQFSKSLKAGIKLPTDFEFYPIIQHSGLLVFRGGFSDNLTDTDSYKHEDGKVIIKDRFVWSQPLDDDENTEYTVNLINSFVDQSFKILNQHPLNDVKRKRGLMPANILLTRCAEIERPNLKKFRKTMAIVNRPLEKGICLASGMEVYGMDYPGMKGYDVYENLYDGLNKMIKFSIKNLKKRRNKYDNCFIFFKEPDIAGHDNKPYEKKNFLEMIDSKFFSELRKYADKYNIQIVVTGDHSTCCKYKGHTSDPVPMLVCGPGEKPDSTSAFSEAEASRGSLGKVVGKNFMKKAGFS